MFSAFRAAGVTGAEVGRVAVGIRALAQARARDRAVVEPGRRARDELATLGAEVAAIASELDRLLLDAATASYGERTDEARELIASAREGAHHLELAPTLIAAARGEPLNLETELSSLLTSYGNAAAYAAVALTDSIDVGPDLFVDPRSTGAMLVTLKRSLDNALLHGRGVRSVAVRLSQDDGNVVLEVQDDGGGAVPARDSWGIGLSESYARCRELGGTLELARGSHGLIVRATVPAAPVEPDPQRQATRHPVTAHVDEVIASVVRQIKLATTWQGIASLMCAQRDRDGMRDSALFVAITVAERRLQHRARTARACLLAAAAALWPEGGRPADGWVGMMLADLAIRDGRTPWLETFGAIAALAGRAVGRRDSVESARIVENLGFPLTCVGLGLGVARIRRAVVETEAETVSLRERIELIESLEAPIHRRHDILSGLKKAGLWRRYFNESPEGQALNALAKRLEDTTERLQPHLTSPDPVAHLQEHLQVRLAPVEITVSGTQPLLDASREADELLQRARSYTGLIVAADAVADDLLARHPRRLDGVWPLRRVHLDVQFVPPDRVDLVIHPVSGPAHEPADRDGSFQPSLRGIEGELLTRSDGSLAIRMGLHVLARTAK
jgi:hypothetical protein